MNFYHRSQTGTGSMLCLTVCITAVVFVPLILLCCQLGLFVIHSGRAQDVVQAAAKKAAMDLSRIVINDGNFGYVSLSNHRAVGNATRAADGEPLPVVGINTLIGTLRQNAILADELHNETMRSLVEKDCASLKSTVDLLNRKLTDSVMDEGCKTCVDADGRVVNPIQDARDFINSNLPPNVQVESLKLSVGWLNSGSETTIPVPKPVNLARLPDKDVQSDQYEAFKDLPVGARSFSFAGLGSQAHLVSTKSFQNADTKHICSIVKVECTLVCNDEHNSKINCEACCQAASESDQSLRGAMTIRFSGRPIAGVSSWGEFLSSSAFNDNGMWSYDIVNGDYPFDSNSLMKMSRSPNGRGTAEQFAEHLYCWLRNGHVRPRIDAVLMMINEPFRSYTNEVYTYEFADDGSIVRKIFDGGRFPRSVVADGQMAAMTDARIKSGAGAIIMFRDSVRNQSANSGKHGGQPLAGYPLESSDGIINYDQLAGNFCKRNAFQSGLALDIEIGGTGDSTAMNDVISMRQRTRTRRI